jgi:hypothetical protein
MAEMDNFNVVEANSSSAQLLQLSHCSGICGNVDVVSKGLRFAAVDEKLRRVAWSFQDL